MFEECRRGATSSKDLRNPLVWVEILAGYEECRFVPSSVTTLENNEIQSLFEAHILLSK